MRCIQKAERLRFAPVFLGMGLLALTAGGATTLPEGTQLQIRLTKQASSQLSSGSPIEAVVIAPVLVGNEPAILPGAKLTGKTKDVKAVTPENTDEQGTLRFDFTKLIDEKGKSTSVSTRVTAVDNARESVQSDGLIRGITASQTFTSRLDQGIGKLAQKNSQLGELLASVKKSIVKEADASIDYGPGVELIVQLTKPAKWDGTGEEKAANTIEPLEQLTRVVDSQPNRTRAEKPPSPSDLTNLMFIGSREQVAESFKQAGWEQADELGRSSRMETARAIIESRGYKAAPVSILLLDDKPPDFVFQKQNNTFAARHHIRIWQRPDQFDGKPIWVGAATHDIAINFSQESKSFTHQIDENIDNERAKVLNDLVFTGNVKGTTLVARTGIPAKISNATGDTLKTDNKMAAIEFR